MILREWLRNEIRLGVRHVGVTGPVPIAVSAPRTAPGAVKAPSADAKPAARAIEPPARPTAIRPGVIPAATADDLPQICDRDLGVEDASAALRLLDENHVRGCTRCPLATQGRMQTVFGVGSPRPQIVFVGEGPGAEEDQRGEPFVGRAGQLLTRMIQAMTLSREEVYIANIVKCRPPGNRTPTPEESQTCSPYLFRQLAILRPKVIVALGRPAAQTLLATSTPIGKLRGQFHDFPPPELAAHGLPACRLMPTFHPAYLLRSPGEKGKAWADLQEVMKFLGIKVPKSG